ncbi:MAG: CRISPR-associated helicase Cas3', partial [Candidatus Sericytochromatia bacterium]|nr:CRISPR-associated helicase Cas3' [Candidatus Sericytochromatia bacterium]
GKLAHDAGLLHDFGKRSAAFQRYLQNCVENPTQKHKGPDHSSAGAVIAFRRNDTSVAFVVAGHHGGIPSLAELKQRMDTKDADAGMQAFLLEQQERMAPFLAAGRPPEPDFLKRPGHDKAQRRRYELFLRMLFSCLVDADFLNTERHFNRGKSAIRQTTVTLAGLWERFQVDQAKLQINSDGPLNVLRREIYEACLGAATGQPGIYRLTVPTGGGKTRSGLAFALRHAETHALDRVIVAIPFTSIIEQTALVYRQILGDDAVLEHHSAVTVTEDDCNPSVGELHARLATENWDAPLVVTTTVQLFESLFANRSGRCRKLHNLVGSIIVLDEVQTLPAEVLAPILDVLQSLVDDYKVTVVLCTATQPELSQLRDHPGLRDIREIVPDHPRHFEQLRRVTYEIPQEPWSWEAIADTMRTERHCLAVLNTKKDALALLRALDDPMALHLSTLLCGEHRRNVLTEVRRRLVAGEPCRLVSTQVVEAGVDLDFPCVIRAIGPLDRIVQAAGRCNREGKLATGRVLVVTPEEGTAPRGAYGTGLALAKNLLLHGAPDLHDPKVYEAYFRSLYDGLTLDSYKIQPLREQLEFREVDRQFRMLDGDGVLVVVPYVMTAHGPEACTAQRRFAAGRASPDCPGDHRACGLIRSLREAPGPTRLLMRQLQPYFVTVFQQQLAKLLQQNTVSELTKGVYLWLSDYDPVEGMTERAQDPDVLVI